MQAAAFEASAAVRPCQLGELRPRPAATKTLHKPAQRSQLQRPLHLAAAASKDESSRDKPDNSQMKMPIAGQDTDWREFRARLVRQSEGQNAADLANEAWSAALQDEPNGEGSNEGVWAHGIPQPEQGCLLLAHPRMFTHQQTYFHLAVILILKHSEHGSLGVILNRPTTYTIGQLSGAEVLCPDFASNPLYLGGDVGRGITQVLHSHGMLAGAEQVGSGVYMGGLDAARKAVRREKLDAKSFKWFTSYAGWGPGQLQHEVESGVWFTASAGPGLVMRNVESSQWKGLWLDVLDCMGGNHQLLSQAMKAAPQDTGDSPAWDDQFDQQPTVEPPDSHDDPEAEAP